MPNNDLIDKHIKIYSDTYLYSKYPMYAKKLTTAIMKDPVIDKGTDQFQDVVFDVKRAKISDSLVKVLQSPNTILLDCVDPLPRVFKVFCARDAKGDRKAKVFIDCTNVITKDKTSSDLIVDESKLISYLINAAVTMIYSRRLSMIQRRSYMITQATKCFSKLFTFIIDYLTRVSIQETNKNKVLYLSAMYFLVNELQIAEETAIPIAKKVSFVSDREATMLNILLDKASHVKGVPDKDTSPFKNIKTFVNALRDVMHFNKSSMSVDIVIERWMMQYGPGTVFALEYFPALSAMMTDTYVGSYLNQQRTIENVCKTDMVEYSKMTLEFIEQIIG